MDSTGYIRIKENVNSADIPNNTAGLFFGQSYNERDTLDGIDMARKVLIKYGIDNVVSVFNPTRGYHPGGFPLTDTVESGVMKTTNEASIHRQKELQQIENIISTGKLKTIIVHSQGGIMAGMGLRNYAQAHDVDHINFISLAGAESRDEMPDLNRIQYYKKYRNHQEVLPDWLGDTPLTRGSGIGHNYNEYMQDLERSLKEIKERGGAL